MLEYWRLYGDVFEALNAASRKSHPLVGMGRGFRVLPDLLGAEAVEQLLTCLKWIIQYTFAVDDRVSGRAEAQKPGKLLDQRNFVQHSLMSLTPLQLEEHDEHPLIRLARLGTVVYSLLVVFPIPAVAAPFHRLASDIKHHLLEPAIRLWWTDASLLIFWATTLGAIASIGSPDRQWYCTILDKLTTQIGAENWADVKSRLGAFLWYEYTNDSDGVKLWREIEESNFFRTPG
jgi:hypothetical protein